MDENASKPGNNKKISICFTNDSSVYSRHFFSWR